MLRQDPARLMGLVPRYRTVSASAMASAKSITTDLLSIDVKLLQRAGICQEGARRSFYWSVGDVITDSVTIFGSSDLILIKYIERTIGGRGIEKAERVALSWTGCHYGGSYRS